MVPPRLVPKSDGYAGYIDPPHGQGQHGPPRALPPGRPRTTRDGAAKDTAAMPAEAGASGRSGPRS